VRTLLGILRLAADVVEYVLNWRFYLCFFAAIALAFWISIRVSEPSIAEVLEATSVVVGIVAGTWWQWGH
jgi:hypothetical protein